MRTFLRVDAAILSVVAATLVAAGSIGWAILSAVLAVDAVAISFVPTRWLRRGRPAARRDSTLKARAV